MSAIITAERPDSADAVVLIAELEAQLEPFYPRASRHGLSVERLLAESVAFFLLRWANRRTSIFTQQGATQPHGHMM